MSFELRAITRDEVAAFRSDLMMGFGQDAKPDDNDRFLSLMPLERTVAAFDDDVLVATLGDFDLSVAVPGGNWIAMAGTTMVTVRPTHRRQGILRAMMRRHLDNAVERREPVAGLWASEPVIYGRFGFGLAAESHEIKINHKVTLPPISPDITVTLIEADAIHELVAPFWRSAGADRPGFIDRGEPRWTDIIADPEERRGGGSAVRHAIARRGTEVVGYVGYRQTSKWDDGVADGLISVMDLLAADIDAHRALWSLVTNVDLFPRVEFWNAAVDDPVASESSNMRGVRRLVTDTLYVRILDLEAALTARTYESDGDVVLGLVDDMGYADGTFRLRVDGGKASVTSTDDAADVTLDIRELGALYLGRSCAGMLATTGRLAGSPESLHALEQVFRTSRAPACPEMF